jgi:general secretion pathway protein F
MVRAGEKGGVLEVTLQRLVDFLEARAAFTEALVSALIYPAIITLASSGAVVFLLMFVVPRFAVIFADLGQTIPLPTQILLTVSGGLRAYWWVFVLAAIAVVAGGRLWASTPEGRLGWDRTLLRLPLAGRIGLAVEVARFTRTLGTLLKSGVPMLGALAVAGEMMTNQVVARAVQRLGEGVKRGTGLAAPMGESPVFPPLTVHMVRVGEETGRLEEMLLKVAELLEGQVKTELKRIIGLLEPAVILGMGLVVAFIVVAMLLAIFSINEVPL